MGACSFFVIILANERVQTDGFGIGNLRKHDKLGLIRTGDLRLVKAGDSGLSETFSEAALEGATTTREASAPS
jgi:hypothetical protein